MRQMYTNLASVVALNPTCEMEFLKINTLEYNFYNKKTASTGITFFSFSLSLCLALVVACITLTSISKLPTLGLGRSWFKFLLAKRGNNRL